MDKSENLGDLDIPSIEGTFPGNNIFELQEELARTRIELANTKEYAAVLQSSLNELYKSRIWRSTKVLRNFSNLIKWAKDPKKIKNSLRFRALLFAQNHPALRRQITRLLKIIDMEKRVRKYLGLSTSRPMRIENDEEWEKSFQVLSEFIMPPNVWKSKYYDMFENGRKEVIRTAANNFKSETKAKPNHNEINVAVISSLYKSEMYIEKFIANLQEQSIFETTEFSIVSVMPNQFERQTLEKFSEENENIKIQYSSSLIGIYKAWNLAIQNSTADFITNANADDLRRHDCLEKQFRTLQKFDWCDVVYQDVLYSHLPNVTWEEIQTIGSRSNLPHVSLSSLLAGVNSPHNAPMWRRNLHDELGFFDEAFETAGDYEFWLRCASANKNFFKIQEPIVAYYFSPTGLSTKPDGKGIVEAEIAKERYRGIILENIPTVSESLLAVQENASTHIAEKYTIQQLESFKKAFANE